MLGDEKPEPEMIFISEKIEAYAQSVSHLPSKVCEAIADYTRKHVPLSIMLTGPTEAGFLGLMVRILGARRVLEIGTYTGYSALAMAEQLPDDGKVVTLDQNPETLKIAQSFWVQSPHGNKIEPKTGSALPLLKSLSETFDLIFIDAEKREYEAYLEEALRLLDPKGLIVVDNTLYAGMVLQEDTGDLKAQAMRKFNDRVHARKDLMAVLLPIRDGVTLIRKV